MIFRQPPKPERPSEAKLAAIHRALARYEYGEDAGDRSELISVAYQETELERKIPALVQALQQSRVLIPVFPHRLEASQSGEKEPCREGELYGRWLESAAGRVQVAEVYSDLHSLEKHQPEARPVPVSGRSFAALAYDSPGRAILDGEIFISRPALAAIATGGKWLPSWENDVLLQQIQVLAQDLETVIPVGIKPQYMSPDILRLEVADKSPDTVRKVEQLQKRISGLVGFSEQVDMLVMAPVITNKTT